MMKRASWKEYQKQIAEDNYYYGRSCIRQNFFPGSEKLFIDMLHNDLGKDLLDDPMHSSCTGIGYHSDIVPLETIMTVVARQFALMTEAGYENFVTSCITSFGVYSEILATWHEFPETEEKARENLFKATGREFRKPASLAHGGQHFFRAGTVYEDMSRAFACLAYERNLTQAFLHHPFEVSAQEAVNQENIERSLMIGDKHIRSTFVKLLASVYLYWNEQQVANQL